MANWLLPTNASLYDVVLDELKSRDDDLAKNFSDFSGTTNGLPVGTIKWDTVGKKDLKWNGTAWTDKVDIYNINVSGTATNITGVMAVVNGGTGNSSSLTQFGVKYAESAIKESTTGAGITGQPLIANTTSGPLFGALALNSFNNVTGSLAVANGGTGADNSANARDNLGVPSLTGTNASGTWSINISGNAATANSASALNTSGYYQVTSLGVGAAAPGSGSIRATGDITAYYSDDKLKERVAKLDNALAKVKGLDVFLYRPNSVAKSLGYTEDKVELGLSAQQMQKAQPELTAPAPISDEYLTIRYDRVTALLVGAIQELSAEVESIKECLNLNK